MACSPSIRMLPLFRQPYMQGEEIPMNVMRQLLATVSLLACFAFANAQAQTTIFSDDFQSGSYSGWTLSGSGNVAINTYQGNVSLRHDGLRQATRSLSSQGYTNVSLSMDVGALYLVNGDYCRAEYSTNGGSSWTQLVLVGDGEDTGALKNGTVSTGLDNNANLRVRFRAYTLYGHNCYGDNVKLTGTPASGGGSTAPEIAVNGSGAFGSVTVGGNATNTLTIYNDGDANLVIGTLSGLGAPFSLVNNNCSGKTVASGGSCTVGVRFAPTATGNFTGTLNVPSNDADDPNIAVAVSGSGTAAGGIYDPLSGNGSVSRSNLSASFLTGSGTLSLMDFSHYALPTAAANPTNTFQGRLTLNGEATSGSVTEVGGNNNLQYYSQAAHLPEFDFDFVQDGTHFIPVTRGKVDGTHANWIYILEPGRVWNESSDNGYSRVAFPFTLQERGSDCMWNGVMTFLFKDNGAVSNVAYQIASETCYYLKANFWGKLAATYTPTAIAGAATIRSNYEAEVARRIPVKPLSALATDYPGKGVTIANIGSDVTAAHMSLYGVAYNGVHYVGTCQTRYGTYPFCEVLDVPSYSTAKSVFGSYGLMRLEQKYAGTQRTLKISSWVSECSGSQWSAPTFEQTLDMATGNYTSSGTTTDEASTAMANGFFAVGTHAQKAAFACSYPYKTTPGTKFIYHSTDTYLLGRAMNQYYKSQAGSSADFFNDVMVDEIYRPLGLSPTSYVSSRTQDTAAQPFTGYGLVYVRDDIVKLGEFLNKAQGKIQGEQTLDAAMVSATLNLGTGGLAAGSSADRYNNGFWYYDIKQAGTSYGCSASKWIPYMSGYGGISVVLFPNGMVYYQFSDNGQLTWSKTALELNKIAAICP